MRRIRGDVLAASSLLVFGVACSAPSTSSTPVAQESAGGAASSMQTKPSPPKPPTPKSAFAPVQAIFQKSCVKCHSGPKPKEGLNLATYAGVMKGTSEIKVVLLGKPKESPIIQAIRRTGEVEPMPPKGPPLSEASIRVIERWIAQGAKP